MGNVTRVATGSTVSASRADARHPTALLAPYLKDYWDSNLGITLVSGAVDSWTGQKLGIVLSAPGAGNRPVYGADSTYFGGKSVVQAAATGSKYLAISDYGADIVPTGANSNIWIMVVGRLRTASIVDASRAFALMPATTQEYVQCGHAVTTGDNYTVLRDSGNANRAVAGAAGVSTVCMWEVWAGSGCSQRTNFGTTYNTAGSAGIATDLAGPRRIGVGARGDGYNPTDYSIRYVALCTSKPPESTIREIYAYFKGDSGC